MTATEGRGPAQRGMALYAATVGVDGFPVGCRAVALTAEPNLARVTVYVPMATSPDLIAGIAATRRVAVVATYPPDHYAVQVKGKAAAVRLAEDQERELIDDRVEGFAEVLHTIGYPLRLVRSLNHWPAFAVEVDVEEVFDQTPGPKAGRQVR